MKNLNVFLPYLLLKIKIFPIHLNLFLIKLYLV